MAAVQVWSAGGAGAPFELTEIDTGPLAVDEVEIRVRHCGLCNADVSMWRDVWNATRYPFVPGHEVVGDVVAAGAAVPGDRLGRTVGVGWLSGSCMHCWSCLGGTQHLCRSRRRTLFEQPGGFASRVRCHWAWAVPLPDGLDPAAAGPLFCAGVTVFRPLINLPVLPTWRVGVVGVGGLGHLALKFLRAWGCEVIAFTSSSAKAGDALRWGASKVAPSDGAGLGSLEGALDLLLVTAPAELDAAPLLATLAPQGRVHILATLPKPLSVPSSALVGQDRSVGGSLGGSPLALKTMLDFAARHHVLPEVERFPMSRINDAMQRFLSGDVRYRIVLDADFAGA